MKRNGVVVAIIEPVGGHGGMNYYDFGLVEGLVNAGVNATLYTCDKTYLPESIKFTVKKPFVNIFGNGSRLIRGIRYVRGLLSALIDAKKQKAKIVHYHFFHASVLEVVSVWLTGVLGMRVVVTAHDVESFIVNSSNKFSNYIYRKADRVIAHNEVSRAELVEKVQIDDKKITVVQHGNYLNYVHTIDQSLARSRLNLPQRAKIVLFFGQIKAVKGLEVLIDAFSLLLKQCPDACLVIAGKVWQTDFSTYQERINAAGITERVILDIRYIPEDNVDYYYNAADVVVLPYHKIYQSGVLLMAMCYKRPVVVSNIPGMLEIVSNMHNGFVFKRNDASDLARCLLHVFQSPDESKCVGMAGFDTVTNNHDWNKIGILTREVYLAVGE